MACLGSTGAACSGANGEVGRDAWLEISPALDIVLSVINGTTYTVTWTPTMVGRFVRLLYRDSTAGTMEEDLVDGTLGTWTSPTVNLLNRQILVAREERPDTEQYTIWKHLDIEPIPNAVVHNGILVTHNLEAVTHE